MSTTIYQTLENRNNKDEIEKHGPYFCSLRDKDGKLKSGNKTPWLGEGYYFWDTRIEDARWWGNTIYSRSGHIICKTTYDATSPLLYDLVGNIALHDEFLQTAKEIGSVLGTNKVSFCLVLQYLKEHSNFCDTYKAIRIAAAKEETKNTDIYFPKGIYLSAINRVQICFFDKVMLTDKFTVEECTHPLCAKNTI